MNLINTCFQMDFKGNRNLFFNYKKPLNNFLNNIEMTESNKN